MREVSIEMFPLERDAPVKKNPSPEYIENIISQGMVADRFSLRRSLKKKTSSGPVNGRRTPFRR